VTGTALLQVEDLHVRYATRVVHGVSFDIPRGETLALVGESGSGKTTTARAALRLVEPEVGSVRFDGIDVRALGRETMRAMRRRMQIVFQDPFTSLDPRITVGETVAEGVLAHRLAGPLEAKKRALAVLAEVGLSSDEFTRLPHELSGGQRQRVAIARALAVDPELLVLDEAVSALDATIQSRVLDLFERLRDERRLTTLFIAHNLAVVQRVASVVVVMFDGLVVEHSAANAFFAGPLHPYSRALLDAVPAPDPARRRALPVIGDELLGPSAVGCVYFNRCGHPRKDAECEAEQPRLSAFADGRAAACFKAGGASPVLRPPVRPLDR